MLGLSTLLVAGGLAYTGSLALRHLRSPRRRLRWHADPPKVSVTRQATPSATDDAVAERNSSKLARANQTLVISSVSLGLTTTGVLLSPILVLASVPAALFIFAPTLREAWRNVRHERRITHTVLDATRITLCVILGYYFALALDTWLRTLAQRLVVRSDEEFQQEVNLRFQEQPDSVWTFVSGADLQLPLADLNVDDVIAIVAGELIPVHGVVLHGDAWVDELLITGRTKRARKQVGDVVAAATLVYSGQLYIQVSAIPETSLTATLRERLDAMLVAGTYGENLGKQSGRTMAPAMLLTFGLMLPFWTPNRAAGFLTTSFGNQMNTLGTYALQNFANLALQHNLLVLDGRALELLNLINTVVIDIRLLRDPVLRSQVQETLHTLRQRQWPITQVAPHPFAVYLLADGDEREAKALAGSLGLDDYFVESSDSGRVALLERLRIGGRFVCYVGDGTEDAAFMAKVSVVVAVPTVSHDADAVVSVANTQHAQIVTTRLETTHAQVVLLERNLNRLPQLFAIAAQFGTSEGFNLAWPLFMDLLDISTTVFVHLGLTYSIIFNYTGLLASALNTRAPLTHYRKQRKQKPVRPIDPSRQLE